MKYRKIFLLMFIMICSVIVLSLTSCDYKSNKGKLINTNGGNGKSNFYKEDGDFIQYSEYEENFKPKKDGGAVVAPLSISNQEFYYATTAGTILLLAKEDIAWEKSLGSDEVVSSAMVADKESNLYAITNKFNIYSYTYSGELRFKTNICDSIGGATIPSDLLCLSDGVIAASSDGLLTKITFDGKIIWKKNFNKNLQRILSADTKENTLVILSDNDYEINDTLCSINPQGNINWKYPARTRLIKYPLATEKNIFLTGVKFIGEDLVSIIYALDNSGKMLWEKELSFVPRYISADDEGNIYANCFVNGLGEPIATIFKFDNTGKIIWKKAYDFVAPSPLLVGKDNIAILGTTPKTVGLYFVDKKDGSMRNINSMSNFDPIMQMPVVRPDGCISFAYFHKVGFVKIDEPWLNKILPW